MTKLIIWESGKTCIDLSNPKTIVSIIIKTITNNQINGMKV